MYEFDQIFKVLAWPLSKYKQINVKIIRDDGGMDTPTTTRASMVLTNIILLNKYIIDIPTVPCFIDSVVMLGQP